MKAKIIDTFNGQMSALHTSARMLDDGVIDPRLTRDLLAETMRICREAARRTPRKVQFAVARP
jgi:geranyl-CoA carboxylase beta subunit